MSTTSGSTYIHLFLFLNIEMEIGGGGGGAVLGISLKLKSVKRVNWEIQNMYYCHKLHIPSSLSVCLSVCLLQKRAMAGRLKTHGWLIENQKKDQHQKPWRKAGETERRKKRRKWNTRRNRALHGATRTWTRSHGILCLILTREGSGSQNRLTQKERGKQKKSLERYTFVFFILYSFLLILLIGFLFRLHF